MGEENYVNPFFRFFQYAFNEKLSFSKIRVVLVITHILNNSPIPPFILKLKTLLKLDFKVKNDYTPINKAFKTWTYKNLIISLTHSESKIK